MASTAQRKELKLPFDTIQWLMGQSWPGNVRELKLAMERAVAMAPTSGLVLPRHFIGIQAADEISSLPEELEEIERARVENALESVQDLVYFGLYENETSANSTVTTVSGDSVIGSW